MAVELTLRATVLLLLDGPPWAESGRARRVTVYGKCRFATEMEILR
jgi:hypothetical protein